MNLVKIWDKHCDSLDSVKNVIEEIVEKLPPSGALKRMQKSLADAWEKVSDSTSSLDEIIISGVQPLPVNFPWQDKDFISHWQLYKDYLSEQHGISMKSRMETARLNQITEFSKGDRNIFIRSVNFYMAIGTPGIFPVNFETIKQNTEGDGEQKQTIKLTIPN